MVSSIVDGLRRAGLVLLIGGFAGLVVHAGGIGSFDVLSWSPVAIGNSILIGVLYVALLDATVRLVRLVMEAFVPLESDLNVIYHAAAPAVGALVVFVALSAGFKGILGGAFTPSWPLLVGVGVLATLVVGTGSGFLAMQNYYERNRQDHAEGWEARMRRLRTQTCPSILYGTLEVAETLLEENPGEAKPLLERLRALLHYRRQATTNETVPLAEEIEAALWYVELVQVQYGENVEVGFDVPDPLLAVQVPRLSLLPLLENAVQHGAASAGEEFTITVTGRHDEAQLCLAVLDTGPGFDTTNPDTILRRGSGISDLYARLREHFGGNAELSLLPQGVLWCAPMTSAPAHTPSQEEETSPSPRSSQ